MDCIFVGLFLPRWGPGRGVHWCSSLFYLQWKEEMKLPPYSYHFPIIEDNMRNASKV